jgi:hypothetical protein
LNSERSLSSIIVRGQNFAVEAKADGFLRAAGFQFDVVGSFVVFDELVDARKYRSKCFGM